MVLEKVKAILSEQFDVEEDQITPETTLADDLGADSLDVVDLLLSLIHISPEPAERWESAGKRSPADKWQPQSRPCPRRLRRLK